MFNGIPEHFHQFIASRTALPLPLPLPLHASPPTFSIHDLQPSQQIFQSHLLHQLHHRSSTHEDDEKEEERVVSGSLELEGMRSVSEMMDPWLKDEVLALLTIRSNMGSGFSDFLWGHVSRKLEELGFKRSAEKCKEKFEEVSKYCNNSSYGDNYRSFSELEALFEDQNHKSTLDEKRVRNNDDEGEKISLNLEENSGNETLENPIIVEKNQFVMKKTKRKKRKRYHKLELLKGFSEVVNKIMVQQEQMHMKLLEDMERREEESVAREESWRRKEMDRLNKEIEIRAQEQAMAYTRESTIIEYLKKFTSSPSDENQDLIMKNEDLNSSKDSTPPISPTTILSQNLNSLSRVTTQSNTNLPTSSTIVQVSQNPNPKVPNSSPQTLAYQNSSSLPPQNNTIVTTSSSPLLLQQNPNSISIDGEDHGKRWPKEEVYSLINLRCNLYNSGEDKENTKAPLWERISQGMMELGYKRSAKKCKEKWENINKYFRKTKDSKKKRSLDSKTCPYFHQLSSLYNQGRFSLQSEGPENLSESPENHLGSCQVGFSEAMAHVDEGERNMVQASPYP